MKWAQARGRKSTKLYPNDINNNKNETLMPKFRYHAYQLTEHFSIQLG